MNIQSTNVRPSKIQAQKQQPAPEKKDIPVESYDDDSFSWGDLGKGLIAAPVVAGIEGIGNTISSIVHLPKALVHSYGALIKEKKIGPVLKTAIGLTLPIAAALTPPLTAIGSILFGAYRGFEAAADEGVASALKEGVSDVKHFHTEMAGTAVKELAEYQSEPLEDGQKPFDIRIIEGATGVLAGAVSAGITGVGAGASVALKTPRGVVKALGEIWAGDGDLNLPAKVGATVMVAPAAVLAAPLGVVGGALYGLGVGAYDAYNKGFGTAIKEQVSDLKDLNKFMNEALSDD